MGRYLLILFIVVPMAELAILIRIGQHIGAPTTIAMVIVIGMAGAWLVKHEGLRVLRAIGDELSAGRLPADRMIDALLILVAGVLLITPGVLTDIAGVLLLVPPTRALVRRYLKSRFQSRIVIMHSGFPGWQRRDDFVDVEARPQPSPADTPTDDTPKLDMS